jgi:DNA-binding SARP family transcriptional activator
LGPIAPLRLQLFGGFEARLGSGEPLVFPTKKSRALLAFLALGPGERHSRDKLASLLWGDMAEAQARQNVRKALSSVRQVVTGAHPAPLTVEGETVALAAEVKTDVAAFESLVAVGTPAALAEAAALYRGHLLDGVALDEPAFDDWLAAHRERFRVAAIEALEKLLAHEAAQHPDRAVAVAARLLEIDPLHESGHRTLIRLYRKQGRRDAALAQYRRCADALWRELRVKPDAETEAEYREVLSARDQGLGPHARATILLVEDDEDDVVTRTRLEGLLSEAGYETVVAADGADALLLLSGRAYDAILSDIRMPLLDGLKLLEIVRDKRITAPVVLISGQAGADVEAEALRQGAADFLPKPVQRDVLLLRLEKVLGERTR